MLGRVNSWEMLAGVLLVLTVVAFIVALWRVYDWSLRDMLDEAGPFALVLLLAFAALLLAPLGVKGLGRGAEKAASRHRTKIKSIRDVKATRKRHDAMAAERNRATESLNAAADQARAEETEDARPPRPPPKDDDERRRRLEAMEATKWD